MPRIPHIQQMFEVNLGSYADHSKYFPRRSSRRSFPPPSPPSFISSLVLLTPSLVPSLVSSLLTSSLFSSHLLLFLSVSSRALLRIFPCCSSRHSFSFLTFSLLLPHLFPSPSSPFPFSFLTPSLLLPHRRILPLVLSLTFCRLSPSDLHLNQHSLKDHSEIFSVEEVARTNITIAIINICFINTHQI